MAETLRIRSYRLYCEAKKLAAGASRLDDFDHQVRRLKREYADVFGTPEAASHVDLVSSLFSRTRSQLRAAGKRMES
jgi:hypothetical protein